MLRVKVCCGIALAILAVAPAGAAGRLVSGPMLGYVTHREALVWVEAAEAREVAVEFFPAGSPAEARRVVQSPVAVSPIGTQPVKLVLPLLEMGRKYEYRVLIDGAEARRPYPLAFTTPDQFEWRRPPADFAFVIGSCAYINDPPYDRPGEPYGKSPVILERIADSGADFMLWLGDEIYYREADYSSIGGLWYRWSHDRAIPEFQRLLAAMPHYAVWDDHDYGPNNSNAAFPLKAASLAVFQAYWGNPAWGEPDNPGVYGTFQFQDAAFILLDNRYYRDESELSAAANPGKSQLGARQLAWLRNTLAHFRESGHRRHTRFIFVCLGGQFLTDIEYPGAENHQRYPAERAEILRVIREEAVPGVVFLTGDVHYTEMLRRTDLAPYPLYEITSSALTSGPHTAPLLPSTHRLADTVVQDNNYVVLRAQGTGEGRELLVRCLDRDNRLRWEKTIRAAELRPPRAAATPAAQP